MTLVDEIFSPRRNSVVIRRMDGNMENSRASLIYMVIMKKKSSKKVGRGMIIRNIIPITPAVTSILNRFKTIHHFE